MSTTLWVTKSIMKKECKFLYIMCAHGNASEDMYNSLYTYNWLFCILSIKSYPPPSSHYLRSLDCSAVKFPLPVYCIAWQEWSFLHYLKTSPPRHRWLPLKVARSCIRSIKFLSVWPCALLAAHDIFTPDLWFLSWGRKGGSLVALQLIQALPHFSANSGCTSSF